ncbi:glycosyltransferase family 2 protein [Candidatus Omnitrophota bacterium]
MIDVSVYVPIRNDFRYLAQCLTSLFSQSYPFAEVLVIDDASSDGLQGWAQGQNEFNIKYIRLEQHKGLAAARNEALKHCTCDYIAAVDADCVLNKDWLSILIKYIQDGKVAGVGGHLFEVDSVRFLDLWRKAYLYQTCGTEKATVAYLPGCNTLFRKEALNAIEGYNEAYYFHHEDTEIGQRLSVAGWQMIYVPDAIAYHNREDTLYSLMRRCWGYRHTSPILSMSSLGLDIAREFFKSVKNFIYDFTHFHFHFCCMIDSVYFFYQVMFSVRAYIQKNNNF